MLIAIDAGHGIDTAGKRCDKSVDPKETREWTLNSRVANYVQEYLKPYKDCTTYRVDDVSGKTDIPLATRVKTANTKGADLYLSIHHNAAVKLLTTGGGIEAYAYTNGSKESFSWRDDLYKSLIKHTGLVGNRSTPLLTANFYVIKYTKMPAVLLELGFMNSKADTPIIITDEYAQSCAKAIVETIVNKGKLKKDDEHYSVQIGDYKVKANAVNMKNSLKNAKFNAIIKTEQGADGCTHYKVQVGYYKVKANAVALQKALKDMGYKSIIKVY